MLSLEICKQLKDEGWPQDRGGVVSHTQNNVLYWFAIPTEPQIDDAIVEAVKAAGLRWYAVDYMLDGDLWMPAVGDEYCKDNGNSIWELSPNRHEAKAMLLLKLLDTMTAEQRDALWQKIGRAA